MSDGSVDRRELLRGMMRTAHAVLEGTMEGVTTQIAQWSPPGTAVPAGATYAHILLGEVGLLCKVIKGVEPPQADDWSAIGLSEPLTPGADSEGAWARRVQVDVTKLRAFAQRVYEATDAYIANASDEELDRPVAQGWPSGPMPVAAFIANVMALHVANHTGEISTLKGEQGLKGYPF